jgi:hypothetical protein
MVTEDCAKAEVAAKAASATRVIALLYLMSVNLLQ